MLPNANAITVLVRMMTLYGMLKSGVGRESSSEVVRTENVVRYEPSLSRDRTEIIAGLFFLYLCFSKGGSERGRGGRGGGLTRYRNHGWRQAGIRCTVRRLSRNRM